MLSSLAAYSPVVAATTEFAVIDLGTIEGGVDYEAIGISENRNLVVGRYRVGTQFRAFIWARVASGQIVTPGIYDLAEVTGMDPDPTTEFVAREVNNAGKAVGYIVDGSGNSEAYLWDIATSGTNIDLHDELDDLTSPPFTVAVSEAVAINDDSPAIVTGYVGSGGAADDIDDFTGSESYRAVRVDDDGDNAAVLDPVSGVRAVGWDIATTTSSTLWIAGFSAGDDIFSCAATSGDICPAGCVQGHWWDNSSQAPLPELAPFEVATQAFGVNETGNYVGYSILGDQGASNCALQGAFWSTGTATPVNLPNVSRISGDQDNRALAIANPVVEGSATVTRVVGRNEFAQVALLWEYVSAWTGEELEDLICSGAWNTLAIANDINDDGWIVGSGLRSIGQATVIRAYLAIPCEDCEDCPADLTGPGDCHGAVNVEDLLVLLMNWGTSGPGAELAAPTDDVGTPDLLVLLAAWGNCLGGAGAIPETVEDCLEKFEPGSLALEQCLAAIED